MKIPADGIANIVDHASSTWTTWGWIARIRLFNATLILAHISSFAVRITDALWSTSSDGVRLRNKSRLAPMTNTLF